MSFVALPWAHSKDHPVPLPDRDVWVNPAHVVSVMPAKEDPTKSFVSTSNNRGFLVDMAPEDVVAELATGR